jgi:hypothetical protein
MARVLVIGDTHCPGMRRGYVDFLKRVAEAHDVDRAVHIGDLVDWASISFHEKSPALHNAEREFDLQWTVHPRFAKVIVDGVIYTHGDSGRQGADAALAQAKDNFRSTVIGHFHSQAGAKWWANPEFRVFGLAVGCGIDVSRLQFEYGRRIVAKPILGCGVVLDGRRALFEPWLLKTR